MIPLFHPRSAPLELTGASRVVVEISSHHRRLASMSFSCSRDTVSSYPRSNLTEALEIAFRLAISFRRSILGHGNNHDRKDVGNARIVFGEIQNEQR